MSKRKQTNINAQPAPSANQQGGFGSASVPGDATNGAAQMSQG